VCAAYLLLCVWARFGQFCSSSATVDFVFLSPGAGVHLGLPLGSFIPLWHRVTAHDFSPVVDLGASFSVFASALAQHWSEH
jgi:hypothetical protein